MKPSGWSFLLAGTILATTAFGPAFGEGPTQPSAVPAREITSGSTADLTIDPAAVAAVTDPAALAAAAIDAARTGDAIAEEMVDRIMTGSIFPIPPGPRTGGLTEVHAPAGTVFSDLKPAPEPARRPVTAPVATANPASVAPAGSAEAAKDEAAKPTESAPPAAAVASEPVTPAAPQAAGTADPAAQTAPSPERRSEVEGATEGVAAATNATETTSQATAAGEPTAETVAKDEPVETSAAAKSAETAGPAETAANEPAKPVEGAAVVVAPPAAEIAPQATPAPITATPVPVETNPVAVAPVTEPARVAATAPPVPAATSVAAVDPTMASSYSTASEPTAKASASQPPANAAAATANEPAPRASVAMTTEPPAKAAVATTTEPPAKAAVATTTEPTTTTGTSATPAVAVPVSPAPVTTDAAIAATLAAEQAAAALKAALEEIQPRAGTVEERADRAAMLAFYADRAFLPLFVDAQGTTDRARAARAVLARADRDGLDGRDYGLPTPAVGTSPEVRAKAEIEIATTVVRFARHLQSGQFDPRRVHELVTPKAPKTEAREVLDRVAGTTAVAEALAAYTPPHEGYRRLKAMLAELRSTGEEQPMVMVPAGPLLKPGQKDSRVALLRERLGVTGVVSDAEVFDPALAEAVMAFQRDRGLSPTGKVGRETVSALNEEKTGTAARIADIISNMERWRWLPRELGEMHVFVNTADFHLDVMKSGRSIHHAKVIVGKPSNPTPIFSEDMRHVVVNPYWNVPYSIVKKEMIGKAQSTAGGALGRGGWEVEIGRQRVDPTTVDWSTVDASKVTIRQRPGDGNALGNIKFLFPNQHAVYLHDTSSRGLFAQKFRALSHGCVRVHEPFSFADAVLSEEPEPLDGAKLKKMIGGGEKTINLKRLVPVHITYFTAWVDDAGQLQTRPDFYGHDGRVKRLLDL